MTNQLIILGGGASALEGIRNLLFNKIQDKLTFGLNYANYYVDTTACVCTDEVFIAKEAKYLCKLPLVLNRKFGNTRQANLNEMSFVNCSKYNRSCSEGVYMGNTTGPFALSLGIQILDIGEIFLLGFDYGSQKAEGSKVRPELDHNGRPLTHWYQHGQLLGRHTHKPLEIVHSGTGKVSWYEATGLDEESQKTVPRSYLEYKPYINESKIKIYNVSENSAIEVFEKISYDTFFKKLTKENLNQDDLRAYITLRTKDIKQQL